MNNENTVDFEKLSNVDLREFKLGDEFLCVFFSSRFIKAEHTIYTITNYDKYCRMWSTDDKEYNDQCVDITLTSSSGRKLPIFSNSQNPLVLTNYGRHKKRLHEEFIRALIPMSEIKTSSEDVFLAELSGDWSCMSKKIKREFIRWKKAHG